MALLDTLQDNFSVPATSATNWATTGAVTFNGSTAVLAGPAGAVMTSQGSYGFATTAGVTTLSAKVSLAGAVPTFEMIVYDAAGPAKAFIQINSNGTQYANVYDNAGSSIFYQSMPGYGSPAPTPYLRIRTTSTSVFFAYGVDGRTWTEIQYLGAFGNATTMKAQFNNYATSAAHTATIDDVNILPAALPAISTLQDDFPGTTLDPRWTTGTSGTAAGSVSVSGGRLNVNTSYPANSTTKAWALSTSAYSFVNSSVCARVYPALTTYNQLVNLKVRAPGTAYELFQMQWNNGNLYLSAITSTGNSLFSTLSVFFDQNAMAWWRIRHTAGTVYFETAPDGIDWATRQSAAYMPGGTAFHLELGTAWLASAPVGGGTAGFDNVNLAPYLGTCSPASLANAETVGTPGIVPLLGTLKDDFTTGPLDSTKWSTTGTSGSTVDVSGGTLNISTAAGLTSPIGSVRSVSGFTFTSSVVHAQVFPDPAATGQQVHLRVIPFVAGNEVLYWAKTGANLAAFGCDTSGAVFTSVTITYDQVAHAWWRIRHTAGTVYWETSPDGGAWAIRLQAVYAPQTDPYRARLYTQWTGTSTDGVVRFDNVNIYAATVTPASGADPEAVGQPVADTGERTGNPGSAGDPETLGPPAADAGVQVTADSIADPETLEDPQADTTPRTAPDPVSLPVAPGAPDTTAVATQVTPDPVHLPAQTDDPYLTWFDTAAGPGDLTPLPVRTGTPDTALVGPGEAAPPGAHVDVGVADPSVTTSWSTAPAPLPVPIGAGPPAAVAGAPIVVLGVTAPLPVNTGAPAAASSSPWASPGGISVAAAAGGVSTRAPGEGHWTVAPYTAPPLAPNPY